jgi:hypothetical protein
MRKFKFWASVALVVVVIAAGVWAVWNFELRWRPKTITRNQAEITRLLESAGWVSAGQKGAKLYVVSAGSCEACGAYAREELPKFTKAGVDARVIMIAPRDENGLAGSTPAERATVAQLWLTKDWKLLERWQAAPAGTWSAAGLPPVAGDMARMAVVEAGRSTVDRLQPMLKANGVAFTYPLAIWWNDKGEMRACACEAPQTHRFVRRELGA